MTNNYTFRELDPMPQGQKFKKNYFGFLMTYLFLTELNESVTLSSPDRMHALSLKIVLLGKIYAGTPRFFPLGEP